MNHIPSNRIMLPPVQSKRRGDVRPICVGSGTRQSAPFPA
uniref:Uncharacterized protein n=1 Tax=Lepeophtheirus salmonis TaxID=72036 RepID=A0A0K2T009_LEPSM